MISSDSHNRSRAPRVTYWTGWLSPEMEGCSKDVFSLKDHFARSRVFGLSRYYGVKVSRRDRYVGLNVRLYPLFRLMAHVYEWTSDIHHVYGSLDEWFFLRALQRRPLVLTVATANDTPDLSMHRHVSRFVAHGERTVADLRARGIDAARIRVIYPGLALDRFAARPRDNAAWPGDPDPARFRVLFATTPNWAEGLETRGVHLMMEAAAQLPDVDFFFAWRPWHNGQDLRDQLLRRHGERDNVHVSIGRVPDMRRLFHAADVTIAPFVNTAGTKLCPTSIVESLASGRPVLVSTEVGIADLVRDEGCGEVFEPTVDALCAAVRRLQRDYAARAARARVCAETHFDERVCLRRHEELYEELLSECC